jgi:hypothetical protein
MRGIFPLSEGGGINYKTLSEAPPPPKLRGIMRCFYRFFKLFLEAPLSRESCAVRYANSIKKESSKCGGIDISWKENDMVVS